MSFSNFIKIFELFNNRVTTKKRQNKKIPRFISKNYYFYLFVNGSNAIARAFLICSAMYL